MSRDSSGLHTASPSGLVPVDGACPDSFLSMTRAFVPPVARVISVLRIARAVAWVTVKVLFVVIAVPLVVVFTVASVGSIFAGGSW